MGLFNKNKNEEQSIKRLSQNAGGIIEMLKAAFMTPNGVDIRGRRVYGIEITPLKKDVSF